MDRQHLRPLSRRAWYGVVVAAFLTMGLAAGSALGAEPNGTVGRPQHATFRQQAELIPSDEIGSASTGQNVTLASNGNVALLGGPGDNGGVGAAWVFVRRGSTWVQQAKLTGRGERGQAAFGTSVALSGDGSTALIGGPLDDAVHGAAWVFTRSGSSWTQRRKLTGSNEIVPTDSSGGCEGGGFGGGSVQFGASVALSRDGDTALIGGPRDRNIYGAAWLFTRSASTWTQRAKLTGDGEEVYGEFGSEPGSKCRGLFGASVALAADGDTALIGGPGDHYEGGASVQGPRGAAWAFTRSGAAWRQQGEKLIGGGGNGAIGGVEFGESVALSADGDTALIGGPQDGWGEERSQGAAWIFTRSGSTWSQEGGKLKDAEPIEGFQDEEFGARVALSADGKTGLVRNLESFPPNGSASLLTRLDSTWTQLSPRLRCTTACRGVALSGDAATALVGRVIYVTEPRS